MYIPIHLRFDGKQNERVYQPRETPQMAQMFMFTKQKNGRYCRLPHIIIVDVLLREFSVNCLDFSNSRAIV